MEAELDKRIALMKENLMDRGKTLVSDLARQLENDIASFNFSGAMEAVKSRAENNQEIKYAVLMDSAGLVFIHTLIPDFTQDNFTERDRMALRCKYTTSDEYQEKDGTVIEIVKPVQITTEPWGIVRVVFSLKHLEMTISSSREQIKNDIKAMIYQSIIASVIFIADCFLIIFILATRLSKPLILLTDSARKLSKGDFTGASDIRIDSKDEVGVLADAFIEMNKALEDSYKKLAEYNRTLEQRVEERTEVLNDTLNEVEEANRKIMESIQYAQMIQTSLLPNLKEVRTYLPDSFFIWMPRDIVGGDIFYTESIKNGFVVAVIDCTGHGVPGAFMTMIASSALRRVIHDEGCYIPGEILNRLNFIVKTSLQQDTEYALSDDGLDAAICFVETGTKTLTFAGAKLPLVYIHNGKVNTVKGDRQSIGYKKSDLGFNFSDHRIQIAKGMCFYIATDGFADQLGEQTGRRFGTPRYKDLLRENAAEPFQKQKEMLLEAFNEHKGMAERQDDLTILGFRIEV